MATLVEWMNDIMTSHFKVNESIASNIDEIIAFAAIILTAFLANWICQTAGRWLLKRSKIKLLKGGKLIRNILLLIPGVLLYYLIAWAFGEEVRVTGILRRIDVIYMIIVAIMISNSALLSILQIYINASRHRNVPMHGLVQALQVIVYFVGGIIIIAVIFDKSIGTLLTGLGASAAVLMLVFKDSILGFVAGVQLSQNKMIQIGDWIQLPDGSANGTVEEITLNTVKVRNWDNTVSMVPPYTLVSTPFKNWRGMQESGGRRADKMIYLDVNSLEICSEDMVTDIIKEFPILKEPLAGCKAGSLTNAQIYRTYITIYLRQHPYVNPSLDIIISQKEATAYGMPVEVYFFTMEKDWALHEQQQSDIFDHLMTVAPEFGLKLYQRP